MNTAYNSVWCVVGDVDAGVPAMELLLSLFMMPNLLITRRCFVPDGPESFGDVVRFWIDNEKQEMTKSLNQKCLNVRGERFVYKPV